MSGRLFVIEITNLDSEIAFEILDNERKDLIVEELNLKFDAFHISTKEWKEFVYFDRERSEIKHCNAYVLTWKGSNALVDRAQAMNFLYPTLRNRVKEFTIHGALVDPVELMVKKLYGVMHNHFFIDDKINNLKGPILWNVQQLLSAARGSAVDGNRWFVLSIVDRFEESAHVIIEFSDGPTIQININSELKAGVLGRSLYFALHSPKQCAIGFVEDIQVIYNMLRTDNYYFKIFQNMLIVEKRKMPFFMDHDDFMRRRIMHKVMPYGVRLADITRLPLSVIFGCNTGAKLVDVYLATYMWAVHHIHVPLYVRTETLEERAPLKGGYITTPQREIIKGKRLVDIDFKSFYPSIIHERNLDFGSDKRAYNILPSIVERFITMRASVTVQEGIVLKFIINNIYGTLGCMTSRFYCYKIAAAITEHGRNELQNHVIPIVEHQGDAYRVIFANTDGLLLEYTNTTCSEVKYKNDTRQLCAIINDKYAFMRIHPAAYYTDAFIYATNNYICKDTKGELKMKGIVSVHKSSPAVLKLITHAFVSIFLDDTKYPQGTKITSLLKESRRITEQCKTDPEMWCATWVVDRLHTTQSDLKDPKIKAAVDNGCIPGDVIQWLCVTRVNYEPPSASYPTDGAFAGTRTFYSAATSISKKNFNHRRYEINVHMYIPAIVKCLKYLCSIYPHEQSCDISDVSFINGFHPAAHNFIEKRVQVHTHRHYNYSRKIICNYCKKVHRHKGFSDVIGYLLGPGEHLHHIDPAKLMEYCSHCNNQIKIWEYLNITTLNYLNVREFYLYTSIISLLNICKDRCGICYTIIKTYKNVHFEQFQHFEQYLSTIMADAPKEISRPIIQNDDEDVRIKRVRIH